MTLHRGSRIARAASLALMLFAVAGLVHVAAAQTKTTAPKAAPKKKAPVRRVVRPRVQTAPTRDRIIEIQEALAGEGFYSGKPSGRWDAATTKAMKDFQTSKGLTPTGKVGALSLQNLGLGSEVAGKAAPVIQADARPSAMSESELDAPEPDDPDADAPEPDAP
jgi:peptidoglycan hydrolase-like protein with peptidoglycan-binding domain